MSPAARARQRRKRYNATPKGLYSKHKVNARRRGIEFQLTFDEWLTIWNDSGRWDQRGNYPGGYVMRRLGDSGPYAAGNVYIGEHSENTMEGLAKATSRKLVLDHYRKYHDIISVGESHE